ncbi:hypothetical protein GGR34_002599 [Microvirga flocculans]|uniref:DUF3035 domain-containing protein n=1 Tax=Microvirga flocculans TaxID=217168 RepID=A0A7W6IG79_9HYPH|nr:hypothetical protein [Microvirga flocculans]MBB4040940.1 hypothetical protein [Microvirga flocculans]
MLTKPLSLPRASALALAAAASIGLAGCNSNPVRDVATAVGAGPQMAATPEFVARSRPDSLDYMPIGTPVPERPTPARTAAEVKAAEAELDALRARNEAAGAEAAELGKTPPPEPIKLPVAAPSSTPANAPANKPQAARQKANSKRMP